MASVVYNRAKYEIGRNNINYLSNTIRAMLMQSSYSANPDSDFVSDVSASEVSVSGYARLTLASKTVTLDDTNDRAAYDGADLTFTALAAGQNVGGVLLYQQTGGNDSSPGDDILIAYCELASPIATNGGDITMVFNASGCFVN